MPTLDVLTKKCSACELEFPIEDFGNPARYQTRCPECAAEYRRKYYEANKEKMQLNGKKYQEDNRDKIRARKKRVYESNRDKVLAKRKTYCVENKEAIAKASKKFREENIEKIARYNRKYYAENREKLAEWSKNYYTENRDKCRAYGKQHYQENKGIAREYQNKKVRTNIQFKLARCLRNRFYTALKSNFKNGSAVGDLGCSVEFIKLHLESQFTKGMTWDNLGKGPGKWNIDHIVPLAAFNLEDRQQVLLAVHYGNLQPLWFEDNMRKSDKIPTWENYRDIHKEAGSRIPESPIS